MFGIKVSLSSIPWRNFFTDTVFTDLSASDEYKYSFAAIQALAIECELLQMCRAQIALTFRTLGFAVLICCSGICTLSYNTGTRQRK